MSISPKCFSIIGYLKKLAMFLRLLLFSKHSNKIKEWANEIGLTEIVSTSTGNKIPTVNNGSNTIDAIFISNSLTAYRKGYLEFGFFPTNHRGIWVDFYYENIFGFKTPKMIRPTFGAKWQKQC